MRELFVVFIASLLLLGCQGGGISSAGFSQPNFSGAGIDSSANNIIIPQGHHPEPTTIVLFGLGALGMYVSHKRKKKL